MIRSILIVAVAGGVVFTALPRHALADPGPEEVDATPVAANVETDVLRAQEGVATDREIVREELRGLQEAERKHRFHSAIGKFVFGAGMIGLGTYFLVDDTEFQDGANRFNRYIGASFIAASALPIGLGIFRLLTPGPYEVGIGDLLDDEGMTAESGLAVLRLVAERDRQMRIAGSAGSLVFGGIGLGIGALVVREDGMNDRAGWATVVLAGLSVVKGTWGLFGSSPGERRYERTLDRIRGNDVATGVVDLDVAPSFGPLPDGGFQGGLNVSGRF